MIDDAIDWRDFYLLSVWTNIYFGPNQVTNIIHAVKYIWIVQNIQIFLNNL